MEILSTISNVSNKILNTVSYASGLINSLRRKNFTEMGKARCISHDRVRRELKHAVKEKEELRMVLQSEAQKKIRETEGKGALILDFTVAIKRHAKKIDSVVKQYAGTAGFKTAKGICMGMIAWTNLKKLILPIDLITWKKGDRPKNQTLIERAIALAQRLDVSTILADSFLQHDTCLKALCKRRYLLLYALNQIYQYLLRDMVNFNCVIILPSSLIEINDVLFVKLCGMASAYGSLRSKFLTSNRGGMLSFSLLTRLSKKPANSPTFTSVAGE